MSEEQRLLRVGVLGAGPISQAAHFEACRKAKNAELYAICEVAEDLLERMSAIHAPIYGLNALYGLVNFLSWLTAER